MGADAITQDAQEFMELLSGSLPPVIAREEVAQRLGGIIAKQTLANADARGIGPEVVYRVGRKVAYRTDSLLSWIVARYGVRRIANLKTL